MLGKAIKVLGDAGNSVFTKYMIQGLETGDADINGDGLITVDELYDYVYERVVDETPKQTPGKWTQKQQGEIVIANNLNLARTPVVLPETQGLAAQAKDSVWFPIMLMTIFWAISWAFSQAFTWHIGWGQICGDFDLRIKYIEYSIRGLIGGGIAGTSGGFFTWMVLRQMSLPFKPKQVLTLISGWAIAGATGWSIGETTLRSIAITPGILLLDIARYFSGRDLDADIIPQTRARLQGDSSEGPLRGQSEGFSFGWPCGR